MAMRTLVLTRFEPYPPIGGAPLRNWQNISILKDFGEVAVFSVCHPSSLTTCHAETPPGVSIWENQVLNNQKIERSFFQKVRWWLNLSEHPLTNDQFSFNIAESLKNFARQYNPDFVIVEELFLYEYLPILKQLDCPIVLDQHNVEINLYKQNINQSKTNIIHSIQNYILCRKLKYIEKKFIQESDQVWVCSKTDSDLIQATYGKNTKIKVLPNTINDHDFSEIRYNKLTLPSGFTKNPHVIYFSGTFGYGPNAEAAQILIDDIFPPIQRRFKNSQLLLVGKSPTAYMQNAANENPNIVVTGLVPDIRPYLSISTVVAVPLIHGGGTRLKILEAFAAKRPVVTTPKGVEGIVAKNNQHLLVKENANEFIEGICHIWSDSCQNNTLVNNAYTLFKEQYSWESIEKVLAQYFKEL